MSDLVRIVNNKCPLGIGHKHDRGDPKKTKNNKPFCFLCDPKGDSIAINFSMTCPNAIELNKYILTIDQKCAVYVGFENLYKKYGIHIPPEIFMIINDILKRGFVEQMNLKINLESIEHMMNCRLCGPMFVKMIDNHACNRHMLPRL